MNKNLRLPLFITLFHIPIFFLRFTESKKEILPKKKITINTIHLLEKAPKKTSFSKETIASKEIPSPKKKKAPVKKVPKKKFVVKKKPVKKKKVVKTLSKKKIQKKLNRSLSSSKPHYAKKSLKVKKNTKNDAGKEKSEYNTYLQTVAEILRDTLTLPEKGKVKLTITIRPGGKISKIVSLSSESAYNLAYLEENLVKLTLPKYTKKEDRIFTIVFCDEK